MITCREDVAGPSPHTQTHIHYSGIILHSCWAVTSMYTHHVHTLLRFLITELVVTPASPQPLSWGLEAFFTVAPAALITSTSFTSTQRFTSLQDIHPPRQHWAPHKPPAELLLNHPTLSLAEHPKAKTHFASSVAICVPGNPVNPHLSAGYVQCSSLLFSPLFCCFFRNWNLRCTLKPVEALQVDGCLIKGCELAQTSKNELKQSPKRNERRIYSCI